jgi:hypothetical protein
MGICQGLASDDSTNLYAAWKGETGDDHVYYSTFNETGWSIKTTMPANSSVGPSLAFLGGTLYAAWKGEHGDNRMFSAEFDGTSWINGKTIPGNSDIGPTLASLNGKLYAAWKGEADLRLFYAEFDGTDWSSQTQMIDPDNSPFYSSCIGPSLAVFKGTIYAAWRGAIFDQGIYYASFDGTNWSSPNKIPGHTSIGPSIAQFGSALYLICKGGGADEQVYFGWFNEFMQWQGFAPLSGVQCNSSIGAALSTFGNKLYTIWKGEGSDQRIFYASFDGSSWTADPSPLVPGNTGQDMAPMPSDGLGSDSNYILSSDCQPITALSVTIEITKEIASSVGVGFQLNCYTTKEEKSAWQQYILSYAPSTFGGQVDNWTTTHELTNSGIQYFCSFLGPNIPVGAVLVIALVFDPTTYKVTGVNFSVDLPGKGQEKKPISLYALYNETRIDAEGALVLGTKLQLSDMSPIVAFEVLFVGTDGNTTQLSSGAGTITYNASPALTALGEFPACVEYDEQSGEKANSVYGLLPLGSSQIFTQTFAAAAT